MKVKKQRRYTMRILVVDDNEQNRYMLQVLLEGHGYQVTPAGDGAEALEVARHDPPDMIISDILMPVMDGFALCREWKKDAGLKAIPFVFYTATYTDPKDEEFALSLGAERFIIKPQEPDVFVEMLREVFVNYETGRLVALCEPVEEEAVFFREHNDALIRKLEDKLVQLEETNRTLEREIAGRKQAEEALRKHREHLEELVEQRTQELRDAQVELLRGERLSALGQLTAALAHEIRNPLGTVRICIFSISDAIEREETLVSLGQVMERVERALQLAERNIVRCDNIIKELLDYASDQTLQLWPTKIDTWLGALLDELTLPQDVVCARELNAGVKVRIDGERLRIAVANVVKNALDALKGQGGPDKRLTVCTRMARGGSRLEIEIHDTGPGIPDDVFPKIFEPLFSTKTFGVGLGLPIVKNIMEQHGGGISILSQTAGDDKPGGTNVVLWLPLDSH
jgi:signal transduction histidine kinase